MLPKNPARTKPEADQQPTLTETRRTSVQSSTHRDCPGPARQDINSHLQRWSPHALKAISGAVIAR